MSLGVLSARDLVVNIDVGMLSSTCQVDIQAILKSYPELMIGGGNGPKSAFTGSNRICITPSQPGVPVEEPEGPEEPHVPETEDCTTTTANLHPPTTTSPPAVDVETCTDDEPSTTKTRTRRTRTKTRHRPHTTSCSLGYCNSTMTTTEAIISTINITPTSSTVLPSSSTSCSDDEEPPAPSTTTLSSSASSTSMSSTLASSTSSTSSLEPPVIKIPSTTTLTMLATTTVSSSSTSTSSPSSTSNANVPSLTPTPTPSPCPFCVPATYCSSPFITIDIMAELTGLLNVDVDISIYLNLAGLLGAVVDTVGGLLGGLLGAGKAAPKLPESVNHQYRPACGQAIPPSHPGATSCEVPVGKEEDEGEDGGLQGWECLKRCEAAAIQASVDLGVLKDCLGVSLNRGAIGVDNCLFLLGSDSEILDLHALVDLDGWDTLKRSG